MRAQDCWYLEIFYEYVSRGCDYKEAYIKTEEEYYLQTGKNKYSTYKSFATNRAKIQRKILKKDNKIKK